MKPALLVITSTVTATKFRFSNKIGLLQRRDRESIYPEVKNQNNK
jgi:hypothetical protein